MGNSDHGHRYRHTYKHSALSKKLTFYILLSSSLITAIAIALLLYRQYDTDVGILERRLNSIKISTIPSIEKSLWEFNDLQAQTTIDGLMNLDDVVHVEVVAFNWDGETKILSAKGSQTADHNIIQQVYPIIKTRPNEEIHLGDLIVSASLKRVYEQLWQQAGFIILSQVIKTTIITLIILLLIRQFLTRHLLTIAQHTKSLKLYAGYNPLDLGRKQSSGPDELDQVVDTLNQMQLTLLEEQKRELRLEKDRAFAEASTQAKTEFLSHMSHEIRTPMNGVLGLIDLLEDDNLNHEQQRHIELIRKSGKSLLAIINDILDLSKIEANKLNLVKKEFSIHTLVQECCSLYMTAAREKNISIVSKVSDDLPEVLVADPLRIKQILLNLLSNAVKYTDYGEVEIKVFPQWTSKADSKELQLHISVNDTGIGIEESHKQRIFEAFEQAADKEVSHGTGLGLSICKKLLKLMNGEIGLNSTLGEGSEFWVLIPVELYVEPERQNQILTHEKEKPEQDDFSLIARKQVLVVEDNAINQQVIKSLLDKLNIFPDIASNGEDALKLIKQDNYYPIILMDCEMPIMDGFEASRSIREIEKDKGWKPARIISLSAHHDDRHHAKCKASGIDFQLTKPIILETLKETLLKYQEELK